MKLKFIILTILIIAATQSLLAQKQKNIKKTTRELPAPMIDSAKWRAEHYIINRDSAYANPRVGLQKLMGGNRRFIEGKTIRPRQDSSMIKKLETGQTPFAVIIACSDSRVPNEMVFDQGFGDLFIIRTAGQVSAEASFGSIEFAVLKLKSKLIVVLGHTECGAVSAAVDKPENPPGHIVALINAIKPAVSKSSHMMGDPVNNAVRQNVLEQVNELRELEPVLSRKYFNGEILIVGAVYDIHTGKVEFLPETLLNLPQQKIKIEEKH
jgi:carbonic anhydrase